MNSTERYDWACKTGSDINILIPTLYRYARHCQHITEFGVRGGASTSAWLHAAPHELWLFDQNIPECLPELEAIAKENGVKLTFTQGDTGKVIIPETDLLFIDTLHNSEHVGKELACHRSVRNFIIFHDTETNGWQGEAGGGGLKVILIEFLLANPEWRIIEHITESNGLTVLARQPAPHIP